MQAQVPGQLHPFAGAQGDAEVGISLVVPALVPPVVPVEEEGEYTEILYDKLAIDIKLKKGLFTIRSLRRRR